MKRFQRVSLCRQKSRFLARRPPQTDMLFEYVGDYCAGRPSIWCCRDHSAGKSVRRATPIPRGSRPSMAALTRSGARNASEMVILMFRVLHFSRLEMLSALAVGSAMTGNRGDQSRPRLRTYRASLFGADPLGQKNFPTPPCRCLPPRDRKSTRWLGKMNDQLVHLDLNVRDVSKDETAVVNGL